MQHGGNRLEIAEKYQIPYDKITDFSANINPFGTPKSVILAIQKTMSQLEHYPDIRYRDLKVAIAKVHKCNVENIYLGNGAAEVIFDLTQVLQMKKVMLLAPTFVEYEAALKTTNSICCYYDLKTTDFTIELEKLEQVALEQKVDAIWLCNPNNPTGQLLKKNKAEQLLDFCKQSNITLIIDEAFMDFVGESESMLSQLDQYSKLFIIRSLTKIFAIPGLRLGYVATTNLQVIKQLEAQSVPWRINSFADAGGQAALADKAYLSASLEYVQKEREFLTDQLAHFSWMKVYPGAANFLFIKSNLFDLQDKLIPLGYLIRDCSNFKGLTSGYYRVAIRTHQENQGLIAVLKKIELSLSEEVSTSLAENLPKGSKLEASL